MSWMLWTILLSCGCIYLVFLASCLWIAKEADEKIDQLEPCINIKHERLTDNTYMSTHTQFHTARISVSNPTSHAMEIETLAKKSESSSVL